MAGLIGADSGFEQGQGGWNTNAFSLVTKGADVACVPHTVGVSIRLGRVRDRRAVVATVRHPVRVPVHSVVAAKADNA